MLALLLILGCGDPYEDIKQQEMPWYTAQGIEEAAGIRLASMPDGQPLGALSARLVVDASGMHLDNRAWFLRLDHGEVIELRGHGRDRNLIYDEPVEIELTDGRVHDEDMKAGFIKPLDRHLARMANTIRRLPSHMSPDLDLHVYIDRNVPLETVRRVLSTANRSDFEHVHLVGEVDGTPRTAIVERPESWYRVPCVTDVQISPHEGAWLLTAVGAPAIAGPGGCTHTQDSLLAALRELSTACQERWPVWQQAYEAQHPGAPIDVGAWQCLGARPRLEGDTKLGELMPLLGAGYAMYPDVVWGERRGKSFDKQLACAHATALDAMDEAQLDVLCGVDMVAMRLAIESQPGVDADARRRILPGAGVGALNAFRDYNLAVTEAMMRARQRAAQGAP